MQACFQVFCTFSGTEGDLTFIPVLKHIMLYPFIHMINTWLNFFQLRWVNKILYEYPLMQWCWRRKFVMTLISSYIYKVISLSRERDPSDLLEILHSWLGIIRLQLVAIDCSGEIKIVIKAYSEIDRLSDRGTDRWTTIHMDRETIATHTQNTPL